MSRDSIEENQFTYEALRREASALLAVVKGCPSVETARERLRERVLQIRADTLGRRPSAHANLLIRVRDCCRAMSIVLGEDAEARSGFSVARALWDVAEGRSRPDLRPGFFAELIHWVKGIEGRAQVEFAGDRRLKAELAGREAAVARSQALDRLWRVVQRRMTRYSHGLSDEAAARRSARKEKILAALGGSETEWQDWRWQLRHVVTDSAALAALVPLGEHERRAIDDARTGRLPFAVTPYYASLMDEEGDGRDRAIRAQVIPPQSYVDDMLRHRGGRERSCDFMLESDTSPVDLVTRRYPAVAILKPFNTCPQICVYCQRNWEIEQAMAPGAMAATETVDAAIAWIARHPAIQEVLVTGGDPLAMSDGRIERILAGIAAIPHVDLIRIGSRTPVTLPMRINDDLVRTLARFRELGRRQVALVTHVEHPYEITMDTAHAVERLRRAGISVYNQLVYTFFVSRRFESSLLRLLLRRIGVDPYYTFAPKGKEETAAFRVPLARLLQEQKEEARLMPGTRRTDEAVYNVPGLGKNYLRAFQNRDLLSVLPDGSRVYEFHPWEKNVVQQDTYTAVDVPILDYLERLATIGEDPAEYESIWYYF